MAGTSNKSLSYLSHLRFVIVSVAATATATTTTTTTSTSTTTTTPAAAAAPAAPAAAPASPSSISLATAEVAVTGVAYDCNFHSCRNTETPARNQEQRYPSSQSVSGSHLHLSLSRDHKLEQVRVQGCGASWAQESLSTLQLLQDHQL